MNHIDTINKLVAAGDREALVKLAHSQGIQKIHHKAKCETIAAQIAAKITQPQVQPQNMKHVAEQEVQPVFNNTEDDVREAIAQFLAKPGFEAIFREDNTWHFRYKGAEDSGNLAIPLRVIKLKAMSVAQGAFKMRVIATSAVDGKPVYAA